MNVLFIDDHWRDIADALREDDFYLKWPLTFYFSAQYNGDGSDRICDVFKTDTTEIHAANADIVVLDYCLDETNLERTGTKALRRLRKDGFRGPVVLYTSHNIETPHDQLEEQEQQVVEQLTREIDELYEEQRIADYLMKQLDNLNPVMQRVVEVLCPPGTSNRHLCWAPDESSPSASSQETSEHDWSGFLQDCRASAIFLPSSKEPQKTVTVRPTGEQRETTLGKPAEKETALRLQIRDEDQWQTVTAERPQMLPKERSPIENSVLPEDRLPAAEWMLAAMRNQSPAESAYRHYETAYVDRMGEHPVVRVYFAVETPAYLAGQLAYTKRLSDLIESYFDVLRVQQGTRTELDSFIGEKIGAEFEYYAFALVFRDGLPTSSESLTYDLCSSITALVNPVFRELYLSDILGPRMVGPSSSHTAGANRLGRMLRRTTEGFLDTVNNTPSELHIAAHLHGSFRETGPGHGTPSALTAGLVGDHPEMADEVAHFNTEGGQSFTYGDTKVHWHGFVMSEAGTGRDIPPLPAQPHPYHENSVALYGWVDGNPERGEQCATQSPKEADLFIIGESCGGGSVRLRYIGGHLAQDVLTAISSFPTPFELVTMDEEVYLHIGTDGNPLTGKEDEDLPWPIGHIYQYPLDYVNAAEDIPEPTDEPFRPPFSDLDELLTYCRETRLPLPNVARQYEAYLLKRPLTEELASQVIDREIAASLDFWRSLVEAPLDWSAMPDDLRNPETDNYLAAYHAVVSGHQLGPSPLIGETASRAVELSVNLMIRNSLHQPIVAAPTGGACGMVPGVLFALQEQYQFSEQHQIDALLTAALIGLVMYGHVPTSGAAMGCQAETGVGAAMAAGMATHLLGGGTESTLHASALTLKNALGLACDPVAGRVSTPCVKRNAFKSVEALLGATLALQGVRSFVSPAQVVRAAAAIGRDMSEKYRETSRGGLARTSAGMQMARRACYSCQAGCD